MTFATDYRPTSFDDIVGQPHVEKIESLVEQSPDPNFLFHGPPGTGKTTTAFCIAHHRHGSTRNLFELNASDERGIDTVRDRIKRVARVDTQGGVQSTLDGHTPIILLDECESMTTDAQEALRAPMERTRAVFVLTANDLEPIHDALESRCHVFAFDHPPVQAIARRLDQVATDAGMQVDPQRLQDIAIKAGGDFRQAFNLLEQEYRFNPHTRVEEKAKALEQYITTEDD